MKRFYPYLSLLLLFSCSDESSDIQTIQIPKENITLQKKLPFSWTKPLSWRSSNPGSLKKAQFQLSFQKESAEAFLVYMDGKTGTLEQNINRWRAQIKLPAIQISDIKLASIKTPLCEMQLYQCYNTSTNTGSIIAFWEDSQGKWFFKMTGSITVLEHEKNNFFTLLKSMKSS